MDGLGDVRISQRGDLKFAFNFGEKTFDLDIPETADIRFGDKNIPPQCVTVWTVP